MEAATPNLPSASNNEQLIVEHMQYARQIARRFYRARQFMGIDEDEFVGAAYLGLCDAASRYDFSRGINFRTYSYFRIRGAIFDLLRKLGCLPPWQLAAREANNSSASSFAPEITYCAKDLSSIVQTIDELPMVMHGIGEDGQSDISYRHVPSAEAQLEERDACRQVRRVLAGLPERERRLIEQHDFDGRSFSEMQEDFDNTSRSWLCRFHNRVLQRLRLAIQAEEVPDANL